MFRFQKMKRNKKERQNDRCIYLLLLYVCNFLFLRFSFQISRKNFQNKNFSNFNVFFPKIKIFRHIRRNGIISIYTYAHFFLYLVIFMTSSPMLSPRFEPWVRAGVEPERFYLSGSPRLQSWGCHIYDKNRERRVGK